MVSADWLACVATASLGSRGGSERLRHYYAGVLWPAHSSAVAGELGDAEEGVDPFPAAMSFDLLSANLHNRVADSCRADSSNTQWACGLHHCEPSVSGPRRLKAAFHSPIAARLEVVPFPSERIHIARLIPQISHKCKSGEEAFGVDCAHMCPDSCVINLKFRP